MTDIRKDYPDIPTDPPEPTPVDVDNTMGWLDLSDAMWDHLMPDVQDKLIAAYKHANTIGAKVAELNEQLEKVRLPKVTVIYYANDGWAAWGVFEHVDVALKWARPRFGQKDEWFIVPLHNEQEWAA